MTARHDPADEPFFREWAAVQRMGGGTSAVATGNARIHLTRSLARSRTFRDILGLKRTLPVPALLVVGSKGKGTAVAAASYTLAAAGLSVGTVTSPPLIENRERIRVNGQAITPAQYAQFSALCRAALTEMPRLDERGYLSPSGLFTLVGVRFLLEVGVDALVIEEGLGGASDEVSLFDYPVVVLTQIFAEHTDVLGGSLAHVAADLAGVITERTRLVVSHPAQPAAAASAIRQQLTRSGGSRVIMPQPGPITETNLALGARAATGLLELGRERGAANAPEDAHSAAARVVSAWRAGELVLPGRASAHNYEGGTWLVDAAISGPGVTAARAAAERVLVGGAQAGYTVLACFPDTKNVGECLAALRGLTVVGAQAGTDYLSYRELTRVSQDGELVSVEAAVRALAGKNVLAVGTMSFVGEVLDALGAQAGTWWNKDLS